MSAARRLPERGPCALRTRLLLSSGAALAACLLVAPRQAEAQAFQGNMAIAQGSATRNVTGATTETISIDTPSAVLDWTPTDVGIGGPAIDFLPAGNVATFQNGGRFADFMVLNRIIPNDPTRTVALNGTIIGQLRTLAGGPAGTGGTVAFYSPGGLLIGSKAVIDVGNLLLTTIDPTTDGAGNFFIGNTYGLSGAVNPASKITVSAGAQINALNPGSYIAMAAPVIEQHGIVKADGSIAYVAAESVSLTINNGLFDINVKIGSSDAPNTIVHDGTTGGPASTGPGDNQRIYMVAVPKNAAITALLQGNVGFDPAVAAGVQNGEIILSAGRNVTASDTFTSPTATAASFHIQGGNFTSDVLGSAVTDFLVDGSAGPSVFSGNVSLQGDQRARVDSPSALANVTIGGNLSLISDGVPGTRPGLDNIGGEATVQAIADGIIRIGGNVLLSAVGRGDFDSSAFIAGNGTGGTAQVRAFTATIAIGGSLTALADGYGGSGAAAAVSGGAGQGGTALAQNSDGTLTIGGTTLLSANGTGSARAGGAGVVGATGTGGFAEMTGGRTNNTIGLVTIRAQGIGGSVGPGGGTGGTGQGGSVTLRDVGSPMTLPAGALLDASAIGGAGPAGGDAAGGAALVDLAVGTITVGGPLSLVADAQGGDASGPGGNGGNGIGGSAAMLGHVGGSGLITGTTLTATANGRGGVGALGGATGGGSGGTGLGGTVQVLAEASSARLSFASVLAQASGTGGAGGAGGDLGNGGSGGTGSGGTVSAGTISAPFAATPDGSAAFGVISLDATGHGGAAGAGGFSGGNGGIGGSALGGSAQLLSQTAPVTVTGAATLDASATAGPGGAAGAGVAGGVGTAGGGTVRAGATQDAYAGGPGSLTAGSLTGTANGQGDTSNDSHAGSWEIVADQSNVRFNSLTLSAGTTGSPVVEPASLFTLTGGGVVTVAGPIVATSGGDLQVNATNDGRLIGGVPSLLIPGDITFSAPSGAIAVNAAGSTPGAATIQATNFTATSKGAFTAGPGSGISTSAATAITAGGNIQVADASAGTAFTARTPGTIVVTGATHAQTMDLASHDIDIRAGAALGNGTTQTILLDIAPEIAPAVIGGTTAGGAYTLASSEIGRITTVALNVQAPAIGADPARNADVILRDFSLSGSQGGNGLTRFALTTPGRVRVDGKVSYANAAPTDTFLIDAGERIQIVTPTGAVLLTDGAGTPGGVLDLRANDIDVTDAAFAATLQGNPIPPDMNNLLVVNSGATNAQGDLQGGTVDFTVGRSLFVQNTGTLINFAGVTAGTGGLSIRASAAAPIDVVAFGRQQNADGSFTTGQQFYGLVDYGKAAGTTYTDASEFNRCNINKGCPRDVTPPEVRNSILLTGPLSLLLPPEIPQLDPIDETGLLAEPLIDEPVTSGGDSTSWTDSPDDRRKRDGGGSKPK